jgi:peptide/nickel transport system substrate-binding protein/oligopeptide transport system substrate-binding protein
MQRKRLRLITAIGALTLAASACTGSTTNNTASTDSGSDPRYGGTMTVAYSSNPNTFDPAVCYDATCWNNMRMLFDRLYDYVDDTMELAPQAAEAAPEISDDGLTYTIKIREGMTFSNGDPVRAQDFAYSYSRILDPATKSPVQSFWLGVEGAKEYGENPQGVVSGIKAVSDNELQIKLTAPNSAFKYVLAMPHSSVIPEGSGDQQATDPVGSGPFVFESFEPGREIKLTRNDDYWEEGKPYVDAVDQKINVDPSVQLLQVQKGQVDLMGDPMPPAKYLEVINDPALEDQTTSITKPSTYFLTLNTQMAPFDDPLVREAVSYAIDRDFLVKLVNGQGQAANQFLPPGIAGYSEKKMVQDQDIEKAKQLLSDAGYPDGLSTTLYTWNDDPWTTLGPQIQQDLKKIGIDADFRPLEPSAFFELAATPDKAPMTLTFWVADFPDGSNFFQALMSCAAAIPGGQNYSFYCNKEMDDTVLEALATEDPDEVTRLYDEAGTTMLADNPVVPLYYGSKTEVFGANVGNYHSQPIWGWDMTNYWKNDGSEARAAN